MLCGICDLCSNLKYCLQHLLIFQGLFCKEVERFHSFFLVGRVHVVGNQVDWKINVLKILDKKKIITAVEQI